ncbi:hypothetical protein GCM10010967_18410 [Dyadobacter beijingensis]|uniref:Outer membrane protein beta-barrel domain-containing protein n=2 Tax=Dyadobacter beijingensis TaxID=365489 RepID=A0ABQ2HMS0_9BACT|nr:hypothetical protein GCM10010967_18410 [Dyadobacter beijingensis]
MAMFDYDNTVQFGVEVPLGKGDVSIQQDLGFGHSSFNFGYQDRDWMPDKQTFKSRTHLQFYFVEKRRMRAYIGPEFLFKKVVYRENQWIGRDCTGGFGPCSFFQNQDVRVDRNVGALHARFGWQFVTPSRITIDLFTGLGFRYVFTTSHTPGVPDSEIRGIDDLWENARPGKSDIMPSIVLGVHFGVILGKYRR